MKWVPCVLLVISGCLVLPRVEGGVGSSRPAAVEEIEAEEGREPLLILPKSEGAERGLPPELRLLILRGLSIEDLARLAGTCQALRADLAEIVRVLQAAVDGRVGEWLGQYQEYRQTPGIIYSWLLVEALLQRYAGALAAEGHWDELVRMRAGFGQVDAPFRGQMFGRLLEDRVGQLAEKNDEGELLRIWWGLGGSPGASGRQVFEGKVPCVGKALKAVHKKIYDMPGDLRISPARLEWIFAFLDRLEPIIAHARDPRVIADIFELLVLFRRKHLGTLLQASVSVNPITPAGAGALMGAGWTAMAGLFSWLNGEYMGSGNLYKDVATLAVVSGTGWAVVRWALRSDCYRSFMGRFPRDYQRGLELAVMAVKRFKELGAWREFFSGLCRLHVFRNGVHAWQLPGYGPLMANCYENVAKELARQGVCTPETVNAVLLEAARLGWPEEDLFPADLEQLTRNDLVGRLCRFLMIREIPSDHEREQCRRLCSLVLETLGQRVLLQREDLKPFQDLLEAIGTDFARELAARVLVAD